MEINGEMEISDAKNQITLDELLSTLDSWSGI
jgi:hypothetical protein